MDPKNQNSQKGKNKRPQPRTDNVLEALRDIGGSGVKSLKKDLGAGVGQEFVRQLFGVKETPVSASGEIAPGKSLELREVLDVERKENKQLKAQLTQERRLREEEKALFDRKSQELKVELHALIEEVKGLAKSTQDISEEVEIAAMQAPANPGIYHVIFFEKLREFIASFRKKIENASIWLQSYNKRAAKKHSFWGQVSKSGSKRLLSPEDYLQRSAG